MNDILIKKYTEVPKSEYTYKDHIRLFDKELYEQNDQFLKLVNKPALQLMQEGHLFPSLYLKHSNGMLIVKVRKERTIPRKGDFMTAVVLSGEKAVFRNWGNESWLELRRQNQIAYSQAVCVWQSDADDPGFVLVGFNGVSVEFAEKLKEGNIISFGPNDPPREYIQNLRSLMDKSATKGEIINFDLKSDAWHPSVMNTDVSFSNFVISQLELSPYLLIQGPPGTGKTYKIAEMISVLLDKGKKVLVTSLTNRALIEVASKPSLEKFLKENRVAKTATSLDELNELPDLEPAESVEAKSGCLTLSTFYTSSGKALLVDSPIFDYVIMDEASQALLGMFEATIALGEKVVWIGDPSQLPPIVCVRERDIAKFKLEPLINGMQTLCENFSFPAYFMDATYRLSKRAAYFTSVFYPKPLISKQQSGKGFFYSQMDEDFQHFFNPEGGPTWIPLNMPVGDLVPLSGMALVSRLVVELYQSDHRLKIAVLTKMKKTVQGLQNSIVQALGNKPDILVDTVERVQGTTCDVCIFFIPNCKSGLSLVEPFFNVATSRSLRHTIIISDEGLYSSSLCVGRVRDYFDKLINDKVENLYLEH